MPSVPRRPDSRHPEDVLWCNVQNDLDTIEPKAGPSHVVDNLVDVSDHPVPLPRSRVPSSSSQMPVPRPRSLQCSSPEVPPDRRASPEDQKIALLQTKVNGFDFIGKDCIKTVKLAEGTLLRPLVREQSVMRRYLEMERKNASEMLYTDLQHRNVGVAVHPSLIMTINEEQSLLLLGVDVEDRLALHKDFERFHFVENVRVGDKVSVFTPENDGMYQGRVVWMGERPRELGTWFQVETNKPAPSMSVPDWDRPPPPRSIYANAAHIHKPLRNNYCEYSPAPPRVQQPEVRNIPIRRVETHFDAENNTTQTYRRYDNGDDDSFARDLNTWDGDPKTVNDATREWRDRTREEKEHRNGGTLRSKHSQNGITQPSRSHSTHGVTIHDRTQSVEDLEVTKGARVGDRCIWTNAKNDERHFHKGTIRFLGYLKGHGSLYAGVEFDDAVGRGTGVFQGETIFQAAENRAGFVLLHQLEVLPRPSEIDGGRHLAVKHKQASAESLSDPPAPPPVPPRPAMRPEDYMIDSFSMGSYVEVCHLGACRSGVVRWVGDAMSENQSRLEKSAIVELDADVPSGWRSPPETHSSSCVRAVLVPTSSLRRDRRVNGADDSIGVARQNGKTDFGSIDSGVETTRCDPWKVTEDLVGRMKGVQGHKNSCYLDATLYAMFVQSTAFDYLLERPARKSDIPQYRELLRLLATEIVYPLRKFHYVRADHVMKVRELLAEIMPTVKGLTSEEKDPEEILGLLFGNVLKAQAFVELINVKDNKIDHTFLCPLVVGDGDWPSRGVVTTQHLLERSMRAAGVSFATPPKNLILQLPRYGQQKVFDNILPLEIIDITSLVNNATQPCASCDKPADGMCPECYLTKPVFTQEVSHCSNCFRRVHFTAAEGDHCIKHFDIKPIKKIHGHRMVLSAVLCIETSHYVAFVRAQSGRWLFFDSMADREGFSDGFNVPQVKECEKVSWWLSKNGWDRLKGAGKEDMKAILGKGSDVDPLVTRLLSDSYICFYQEEPSSPPSSSNNLLNMLKMKF